MSKQCPGKPGELSDECSPVILRLERARLDEPRGPSLTLPEWELLQACGLGTLAAVRRRMSERAMLAAYDGAPSALSEFAAQRLSESSMRERVPNRDRVQIQPAFEDCLETRLDYDPEKLRVTVQCTVTRRLREQAGVARPRRVPEAHYYAVTFDVRDGGVILRECGRVHQASDETVRRGDIVREFVPQSASRGSS